MTQLARLFRALADTNRLRILNILTRRPFCVCDIQSVLGLPQPFISRHLAYLRRTGLVRDRREGMRVIYSLATEDPCVKSLRTFLAEEFSRHAEFAADLERLLSEACCTNPSTNPSEERHEHQNPAL